MAKKRGFGPLPILMAAMAALILPRTWAQSPSATAAARCALVIGNGAYTGMPSLKNPANDAADMAAALKGLGFSVTLLVDANRKAINQAIVAFRESLARDQGSEGLFYFAGHGIQSKGVNYLIPSGAEIRSEADLEDEAVSFQRLLASLDEARNRVNLVVFDACRDNPLPATSRSLSRGLAVVSSAPPETVVLFSTGAGQTAADGEGRNSPFAAALLAHLGDEGDIMATVKAVTRDVKETTNGAQIPYLYSSLTRDLLLNRAVAAAGAGTTSPIPQRPPSAFPPLRLPPGAVGQTLVDLEGEVEIVRIMDTNLGRLIAAGLRRRAGADIGLMNAGGIRDSIPAGYITQAQVSNLLPFGNRVVSIRVTGVELKSVLENGVSKLPAADGRFPQLSGASFLFDVARRVGDRVTDILVGDRPVDPKETYRLATVDYVANGGDGYSMLAGKLVEDHGPDVDALLLSLASLGQITEEKIAKGSERTSAAKFTGGILVSAPAAGVLALDGKDLGPMTGKAQTKLEQVEVGMHRVALRYPNGTVESQTLNVERDKVAPVKFYFVAARNPSGAVEYLRPGSSSLAPLSLLRRTIRMTGNASDWEGIDPIWDNAPGGKMFLGQEGFEFVGAYVCRDGASLFIRVDFASKNPLDQPPTGMFESQVFQINVQHGAADNLQLNLRLDRRTKRIDSSMGVYTADTKAWKDLGKTAASWKVSKAMIEVRLPLKEINAYLAEPRPVRLRLAAADADGNWLPGNLDSPTRFIDFK
jgi:hypothetical protein